MKDIATDKKYLMIDFWATWCAPCRKAIPEMRNIHRKYNDKGLEIVSISIDKEHDQWIRMLEEENMTWLNIIDKNDIADNYGVKSIPSVFIIEKSTGKVLGSKLYGDSVAEKLKEVFGF